MSPDFGVALNYRATTPGLLSISGETMGTHWVVRLAGVPRERLPLLQAAVESVFERVIAQMSGWSPESSVSRYNRAPGGTWHELPEGFAEVLEAALELARETGGAFDPAVGPLVALWGFGPAPRRTTPPHAQAINAALRHCGWQRLRLAGTNPCLLLQPGGLQLDLSGIAKGYAVDRAAVSLQALGVEHCLVEIGGELAARGRRPDGSAWRVGIEEPSLQLGGNALIAVPLADAAIATSGNRWHGFEHEGRRYSHTIDPRSGWPVAAELASVTVVDRSCMRADALATALLVLGIEEGSAFAEGHGIAAMFLEHCVEGVAATRTSAFEKVLSSEARR
jgi:thiamine biosynthesis lipoprotein